MIRGKAFVAVAAMSREHHVALLHCCQAKLVTYIERDTKRQTPLKGDNDSLDYLRDCLRMCIQSVLQSAPKVIQNLIAALEAVSGRRHPSAAQSKELRSCIPLLSIVLHLVTSSIFRDAVVNESFVGNLGQLVAHVACIDAGTTSIGGTPRVNTTDSLTNIVLSTVEAIAQHPSLLLQYRGLVIESVLPHLAALACSREGDVRMLCFKMFADIAAMFLDDETFGGDQGEESINQLSKVG